MKKSNYKVFAILLVILILLSACGNGTTDAGTGAPGTTSPGAASPSTASPGSSTSGSGAASDATLRVAFSAPLNTLSMAQADGAGTSIMMNVSDALVRFAADGSMAPGLALEWKEIDEKTWQFKLREDVTFSNGESFNADAVVYNYEKLATKELDYRYASHWGVAWPISVEKVDEYTVNFVCSGYSPLVPGLTARVVMYAPGQWEAEGDEAYMTHPVGVGPYIVKSWNPGLSVELEAYDGYWGGAPQIKKVVVESVTSSSARVSALQAGEFDIVVDIPYDQIAVLESNASGKYTINMHDGVGSNWMGFNGLSDRTDRWIYNETFRKAICHAINQEDISKSLLGGYLEAMPCFVSNKTNGGNTGTTVHAYDPELSKQLLKECGYDGTTQKLAMAGGEFSNDVEVGELIVAYLQAVGINVEMQQMENSILETERNNGNVDITITNTPGPSYGDSIYYWSQVVTKRGYSSLCGPEIVAMFEKTGEYGLSSTERTTMLAQANTSAWNSYVFPMSLSNTAALGVSSKVKGYDYSPTGWLILRDARMD
ncbi:MAG: ABC transporter substrate-binding protein [Puniceicoccales bacterium]|jgi:peptide/nickel transport system substrate-binding protein|nr:ABC transporter substrate-binding protein [Puniceicoccales bacterium]